MTEPTDPTFSDAVTPNPTPVDAPVTPAAPVAPVPAAEPTLALTASQIQAMIQQAVESAIGSMGRFNPAIAAPPEPVRPYTPAELFTKIVHYIPWHTEREKLSAFAGVEELYPVTVDGE